MAIAFVLQGAQPAPVLTLDEALKIAEANAYTIRIAQTRVERQRQQLNEARGTQGPRVVGSATYQRFGQEITQSGGSGGGSFVVQPIDSKTAAITVSMPLDI